jgi:hypothetical protein
LGPEDDFSFLHDRPAAAGREDFFPCNRPAAGDEEQSYCFFPAIPYIIPT